MLGLIKKDLLMVKSNLKVIIIILIVFGIMALQGQSDLSFIPALTSVMVFMSTFSYDEYNKFDAFAISLPNGRKNVVKAKYISSLLLVIASVTVTIIASIGIEYIKHSLDWEYILSTSVGCLFACVVVESVIFPLIFKFGVEKGRIGLFIGAFAFSSIIAIIVKTKPFSISKSILSFLESNIILIMIVTFIFLLTISYLISNKVYSKKEF